MRISRFLAVSIFSAVAVTAIPIASLNPFSLAFRSGDADIYGHLDARALTPAQLSPKVIAVQKTQGQKQAQAKRKSAANTKMLGRVDVPPKAKGLTGEEGKKAEDKRKLTILQDKSKAMRTKQTDRKAAAAAKWEAQKLTPDEKAQKPSTKPPKMSPADRQQVKDALSGAAGRMKNTANIPQRKDQFTVGTNTYTGTEVRKAVMNSNLHEARPAGQAANRNPKAFRNDPYGGSHPDTKLAGKRPIPGNPAGLKEFPVIKGGLTGYNGGGSVGPGRVITSSTNGQDTFHGVIAHDPSRGGANEDHYLATKKAAPPPKKGK
ncbi:hypothetical protein Hypma_010998 [Hypsizygus marmoreus]|uniref:Uncharacterized protein n=1 Tax=Hypsizygus marmoreus TaxID=39966 RepID=A0A369JQB7_HYPMA|nr:hypothetical protein Hypma_010998 [Hypsizygus marmoreus]